MKNSDNTSLCVHAGMLVMSLMTLNQAALASGSGNFLDVSFTDESHRLIGFEHQGQVGDSLSGVAWFDMDNDGWLDFYVANGIGGLDGLMRNDGDGGFTNVIESAGIGDANGSSGVVAADLNNDGYTDIVAVGEAGVGGLPSEVAVRIFKNNGDMTFEDVTANSGLAIPEVPGSAMHVSLGDIDNDGLLDLFFTAPGSLAFRTQTANSLWKNDGNFQFSNISAGSNVDYAAGACAAAFSHYDDDSWIDLFVADCNNIDMLPTSLRLFKNNGDLTFTELTQAVGLDTVSETDPSPTGRGYWMCVGLSDLDNDRDFDLFSTNFGGKVIPNQEAGMFERNTNGTFTSVETEFGLGDAVLDFGWGCSFADFNNDGFDDLAFVGNIPGFGVIGDTGNPGRLLINDGGKQFRQGELPVDLSNRYTSGLATADYNNDGFSDILAGNGAFLTNDMPVLLLNQGNSETRSLTVRLIGMESNRSAVGARVQVELPGRVLTKEVRAGSSILSQDSPWLTFGLARQSKASVVTVKWPSGHEDVVELGSARPVITIKEGVGIVPKSK